MNLYNLTIFIDTSELRSHFLILLHEHFVTALLIIRSVNVSQELFEFKKKKKTEFDSAVTSTI